MIKDSDVKKFRNAIFNFWQQKFKYCLSKGQYDLDIKDFLKGDTLQIGVNLTFYPNDIIFMRALIGMKDNATVIRKVKKLWNKENIGEK